LKLRSILFLIGSCSALSANPIAATWGSTTVTSLCGGELSFTGCPPTVTTSFGESEASIDLSNAGPGEANGMIVGEMLTGTFTLGGTADIVLDLTGAFSSQGTQCSPVFCATEPFDFRGDFQADINITNPNTGQTLLDLPVDGSASTIIPVDAISFYGISDTQTGMAGADFVAGMFDYSISISSTENSIGPSSLMEDVQAAIIVNPTPEPRNYAIAIAIVFVACALVKKHRAAGLVKSCDH
jgi:hypothetical protein